VYRGDVGARDGGFRLHWWLAEAEPGELHLDPAEVGEARWILPEEFAELHPAFPSHRQFFGDVLPVLDPGSGRMRED
jgi:8-oxo-dGTP diphosphatase